MTAKNTKRLTEDERRLVKNRIKTLIREAMVEQGIMENPYDENAYMGKKASSKPKSKSKNKQEEEELGVKRSEVMKWLDSAQSLHSVLAYKIWPDMDKDEARSLFSKKYRGEDADGNSYSFDDDDITKLFNMKDRFIDAIS